MTPIQRTLREEKWVLTEELHQGDYPPVVEAFRALNEPAWDQFVEDTTDNPALKFFNTETGEFSSAASWVDLLVERGLSAYSDYLAIPQGLHPQADLFCRQMRREFRAFGVDEGQTDRVFYKPGFVYAGTRCVLVVHHSGPEAKLFPLDASLRPKPDRVDELLARFGLRRVALERIISAIDLNEQTTDQTPPCPKANCSNQQPTS